MTPERWQQVARVYHAVLERAPEGRAAYLAESCGGDAPLRAEVESLLAQDAATVVVDLPLADVAGSLLWGSDLSPGTSIGSYRIVGLLGAGGMGEVYRAHDTKLNRDVALKILPDIFVHDPDRVGRFTREAHVLASLNHPHIAGIYGFEDAPAEAGLHVRALVLELVDGPTLAERIARGPLPIDEALGIARQIAEALEAAHEHGIVHRDLKPANIKVRDDGTVKVLDFGLAKPSDTNPAPSDPGSATLSPSPSITSPAMTSIGVILGTAAYMSPEQAKGKVADKRSDVWAFGCVLYEMLTGRRAFDGGDITDVLGAVVRLEPSLDRLPPDVPAHVRNVIRLCLRKPVRERLADMGSVRLLLDGAFEAAAAGPDVAPAPKTLWRPRVLLAPTAALVGALSIIVGTGYLRTPFITAISRFDIDLAPNQVFNAGRGVLALSGDGRRIAYAAGPSGRQGLYLRQVEALESRQLISSDSGVMSPFFSPDGEWIGYWESGVLKRISVRGGTSIVIGAATSPLGASWGTDGTILFAQNNGILRVPANGGPPTLAIKAQEGEQLDGPQLLPDGDSVLFSVATGTGSDRWDRADIVVQSIATGMRTVVLHGGSDARYLRTGHLIYAVRTTLLAAVFDASRRAIVGSPVPVVEGVSRAGNPTVNSASANYAVSDTGTLVYARGRLDQAQLVEPSTLVWVDRGGREESLGTPTQTYSYARLSPDGTRVAVDVRDAQGPGDIWIWDIQHRGLTRLTLDPALDSNPVWSPDGERLTWASQRSGALNLYWQSADGAGPVERLTQSGNAQRPSSFTPDGVRLLFAEGPVGTRLAQDLGILPLQGDRHPTFLLRTGASEVSGEVSPDGRWLAYESDESGRNQIYVRPFPDVDQSRWQVSTNGGQEPLWSRDGKELFYLQSEGTILGVPVDGDRTTSSGFTFGAPTAVVKGTGYRTRVANQLGRTYDISLDGRRFLRMKLADTPPDTPTAREDIVVVLNWLVELKRLVPTD